MREMARQKQNRRLPLSALKTLASLFTFLPFLLSFQSPSVLLQQLVIRLQVLLYCCHLRICACNLSVCGKLHVVQYIVSSQQ